MKIVASIADQINRRVNAIDGTPYIPADIQPVGQKDVAGYVMLNFGSDELFGEVRFSGNVGVRYVDTRIRSEGSLTVPSAAARRYGPLKPSAG